ncbi:alpha/beta hydrolase [Limosilactobacillus gastricus]|uniref:alpha/beta hydrolase n=1 Tax=Limosilactobacillus gastricus TaxID=227942 RepID=UPI0025F90264|nr:alpha/beta fold hydrolase [Limosilactobacillus gastricus]
MEIEIQRDGLTLRGELSGTDTLKNETLVVMMHGFKGSIGYDVANLLFDTHNQLNLHGLPTLRINFNGCGDSDGEFKDMTVLNEIQDGIAILEYVQKVIQPRHLYLVGHSQGGVVASMLAAYYHDQIEKLVLLAPAATLVSDAQAGICQGVSYDPQNVPDSIMLDGFEVGGAYFRTAQHLHIYETAQGYQGPVLLVHGLDDQVVSYEATKKYDQIYQNDQMHLIAGASHNLMGDQDQRQVVKDLVTRFLME